MSLILPHAPKKVAAPAIVRASAYWTPRMMAKEAEAKKPKRNVAAHQIEDMIENRKVIALNAVQARKFKKVLKAKDYTIKKSMPFVQSKCDATGVFDRSCILFFPKEIA